MIREMKRLLLMLVLGYYAAQAMALSAIVGRVDYTSAKISVFSGEKLSVKVSPADSANKQKCLVNCSKTSPSTSVVEIDGLSPATKYAYTISDSNETLAGTFKTSPDYLDRTPPPDFSFAVFGTNHFNDKPFDHPFKTEGGEYEIFATAQKNGTDFAVWAGGLDTLRNADKSSELAHISRFAKAAANPQAQKILLNMPNYGVVSGAAFGSNTADKFSATSKNAKSAFEKTWAWQFAADEAAYYSFSFSDAEFFVLDVCSRRSNLDFRSSLPEILGREQMTWLEANLAESKATFKIIVAGMPITNPVKSDTNFTFADRERKELLEFLASKKIGGLFVVSANKPYAEITRFIRAGAYPITELTAGASTARADGEQTQTNYFRMPSSLVKKRSFAVVKIFGAENDRQISVSIIGTNGETLFKTSLKNSELTGK